MTPGITSIEMVSNEEIEFKARSLQNALYRLLVFFAALRLR